MTKPREETTSYKVGLALGESIAFVLAFGALVGLVLLLGVAVGHVRFV